MDVKHNAPEPKPDLTVEQKLILLIQYEDSLCRIADAPRGWTLQDARNEACVALGIPGKPSGNII